MRCRWMLLLLFLLASGDTAQAQTSFSSGSTGADGPLDLTEADRVLQIPPSGVFHFTTVNIPYGRTLTFLKNLQNTPVVMLAQGDVLIAGGIYLDAAQGSREPGPGGFYGGEAYQPGFGPGGGAVGQDGRWVGSLSLVPIIGGSGGGGAPNYGSGGGGGGAIVIASSTSILVNGRIEALGTYGYVARGAGGAIRLVSNAVNVSGALYTCASQGDLTCGVVRVEAPDGQRSFTGISYPWVLLTAINPEIVPATPASLSITSIGGYPVTSYSGSRPGAIDVLLPAQLVDPIAVGVQARNIPVGTEVILQVSGSGPNVVTTPATLAGSFESSTATLSVSGLGRSVISYLFVTATFDAPQMSTVLNPPGVDHVAQVRVRTAIGTTPTFAFLRSDGSEVDPRLLSPAFLRQFGQ